jgi:acyl-homoserine-lactone acylase
MRYTLNPMNLKANHTRLALFGLMLAAGWAAAQDAPPNVPPDVDPWTGATLYRDEWGVPHVYAQDPRAMAFAFGYAQAQDHIEPMLMAYRMANGRAAEVLGEPYADSDAFALKMGHAKLARGALDNADPVTLDLCTGFAQGVNAWMTEHPDGVPEWAEGVQPPDVLALWHAYVMSEAPFDLPGMYHWPRAAATGNAWALAPSRTDSGKSILVINPHGAYDGPFRWCEAHLVTGPYDMAGATLYGLPVILQGHNARLGWAMTPSFADTADVFEEMLPAEHMQGSSKTLKEAAKALGLEEVSARQLAMLRYMAESESYRVRTEGGMQTRRVSTVIGARGPMFERGAASIFSWRAGGGFDFGGLRQLFDMGCALNFEAWRQIMLAQQIPCFHFVYADADGAIFYLYNAKTGTHAIPAGILEKDPTIQERIKQQPDFLTFKKPLAQNMDDWLWKELVPLNAMPNVLNPASGYVQACGNPPWTATDNPGFGPDVAPSWLVGDVDTYRAKRVRRLLGSGMRSMRDCYSMLYDTVAGAAAEVVPSLLSMAEKNTDFVKNSHPDLATGLDLLRHWPGSTEAASTGTAYYDAWWKALAAQSGLVAPDDAHLYRILQSGAPRAGEMALNAAADAARGMRNAFQSLSIPWGDVHRIRRGPRDEAVFGGSAGEPIFVASGPADPDGRQIVNYGYAYAMVVQFGDRTEALSMAPFGASERVDSPHFSDQLDLLLQKRLKRTRYARDEVWRYAASAHGRQFTLFPLGVEGSFHFSAPSSIEARLTAVPTAPAPLPKDMAAFTLFTRVERAPHRVPAAMSIELGVPEPLCKAENLLQLVIYVYTPEAGWAALPKQACDHEKRVFSSGAETVGVFAVLGPESCLLKAAPEVKTAVPKPEKKKPADVQTR